MEHGHPARKFMKKASETPALHRFYRLNISSMPIRVTSPHWAAPAFIAPVNPDLENNI